MYALLCRQPAHLVSLCLPLLDALPIFERAVLEEVMTRRSSIVFTNSRRQAERLTAQLPGALVTSSLETAAVEGVQLGDRKSTRLNSSHVAISYAVFCLKKTTDSPCAIP